ncbi:MAG: SHOCT domain-containing protein [Tissierellia bacterium]|nr:SHOCT domain-containing protein [Tissierellia bacterium]MDD4780199.1 SHOCT domain-containing protein [Tissierellia bacterium]
MSKRIKVKPGKGQSLVGFIVGIVFSLIGLIIVIPTFGPFGLFWTLIAIIITITHGKNAFTDKGVTTHEIIIDDELESKVENYSYSTDSQKRLEELKHLHEIGFISKEEYEDRRKNIIDSI